MAPLARCCIRLKRNTRTARIRRAMMKGATPSGRAEPARCISLLMHADRGRDLCAALDAPGFLTAGLPSQCKCRAATVETQVARTRQAVWTKRERYLQKCARPDTQGPSELTMDERGRRSVVLGLPRSPPCSMAACINTGIADTSSPIIEPRNHRAIRLRCAEGGCILTAPAARLAEIAHCGMPLTSAFRNALLVLGVSRLNC